MFLLVSIEGITHGQNIFNDSINQKKFSPKIIFGTGIGGFIGSISNFKWLSNSYLGNQHRDYEGVYAFHLFYKWSFVPNRFYRASLQIEKQQSPRASEINVYQHLETPLPNNELIIQSEFSVQNPEIANYYGLSLGYEFQKRIKKWNFFYGGDLILGYYNSLIQTDDILNEGYYSVNPANYYDRSIIYEERSLTPVIKYKEESIRAGIAPFVGVEYFLGKHISFFCQLEMVFSTELNKKIGISIREANGGGIPPYWESLYNKEIERKETDALNDNFLKMYFMKPSVIGFNFHF